MHCTVLLLCLGILASTASGQSNGTAPTVTGAGSRGPFYSNTSMDLNNTATIVEKKATLSVPQFYELVSSTCKEHISTLQTCPKSTSQQDAWLDLAMRVAYCVKDLYDTECNLDDMSDTKDYSTYRVWVRDHLNMTNTTVEKKEGCEYPDFIPILNAATDKSMQFLNTTGHTSSDYSPTICGYSAGDVIITAPVQYVRCVRQTRSPNDVAACVLSTIDAVRWISLDFFIYGGQDKKCKTGRRGFAAVLVPMLITFVLELVRFAIDVWLWRRKCSKSKHGEPPKMFSWISLCENLISGFGMPFLVAYIVYPRSFEASALALIAIFILKPRASPLIAIPAKRLLGTGYGAQLLFVDSLIALAGVVIAVFADVSWASDFNLMFSGPQSVRTMNIGLGITFLPLLVMYGIYNISGAFYLCFLGIGILVYWLTRNSRLLKWAFSILLFWWGLIICFALSPIFALVELGWLIHCKRKKLEGEEKVFFLAKFFAIFFDSESGHWLMKIGKRVLYYPWCVLMFAVFVGRWMALVNLMAIAGDAFCPASWAETAVAYVFFTLFTIVIPTTLHFFGLSF